MSIPDHEADLITGLVQEPSRLAELVGFEPRWFASPETKVAFAAARIIHTKAAINGVVRYATPAQLQAEASKIIGVRVEDKRRAESLKRSLASVLDRAATESKISDHAFRASLDEVRTAAQDEEGRVGMLELVRTLKKNGSAGLSGNLRDLAARVSSIGSKRSLVGRLSEEAAQVLSEYAANKNAPSSGYIPTPFPHLNKVCQGGGRAGRMWMVAAYTGDGKTAVAKDLIYGGLTHGLGALIVTAEQTRSDVRRLIAVRHTHQIIPGGVSLSRYTAGTLSPQEELALNEACKQIAKGTLGPASYFQAPSGTTMADIRSIIEAVSRDHPIDMLMLDHTLLFQPSSERRSFMQERDRVSEVIREMKQITLDANNGNGLWGIACHQISRDGYDAACKRGFYVNSDLAATSEAERSADLILWILRTDALKDINEAKIGVSKDRYGPGEPKGWDVYERLSHAAMLPIENP